MARPKTKKRAAKSVKRKKFLFIPYPLIIFLLLCAGVYLVAWTINANAADLIVKAIVKDKPITDAAVITSPTDGTKFTAVPITVSGTCPEHGAYVEIFRNGFMGGSAICSSGTFSMQSDLFIGQNKLEAHIFNLTDDEGPISNPVNVTYTPPAPAPGPGTNLQTSPPARTAQKNPLLLKTAFIYKGYYVNQAVVWPLEISGGNAPYAISVDWSDGQSSIISRPQSGQFDITHTYKQPSDNLGDYAIKIQASDSAGNYTYLQFFVIVNVHNPAGVSGNIYSKGPPSLGGLHSWLWAVWPLYLSVVAMAAAFKLGEREEFLSLKKRHQLRRS